MEGHSPPVPPRAAHGHLALTEAELVDWGERFGRAVRPPLVVTLAGIGILASVARAGVATTSRPGAPRGASATRRVRA